MGQFKIHLLKTKLNSTVIFQNQYFVLLVDIVFFPPFMLVAVQLLWHNFLLLDRVLLHMSECWCASCCFLTYFAVSITTSVFPETKKVFSFMEWKLTSWRFVFRFPWNFYWCILSYFFLYRMLSSPHEEDSISAFGRSESLFLASVI